MKRIKRYNFTLTEGVRDGLKTLKERDGIPHSAAVRQALVDYLKKRGIVVQEKGVKKKRSK